MNRYEETPMERTRRIRFLMALTTAAIVVLLNVAGAFAGTGAGPWP